MAARRHVLYCVPLVQLKAWRAGVLPGIVTIMMLAAGCAGNETVADAPNVATTAPAGAEDATIAAAPSPIASDAPSREIVIQPGVAVTTAVAIAVLTETPVETPSAMPTVSIAALLPTPTPTTAPANEPTPDGVKRQIRVPILMYHYLSTPPAGADIYRQDLSVPPERFAAHLDRLLAEGYTTVNLYQVFDALQRGVPLPEKPVVITFDDGYRDNYENAFPLLKARSMQATIFVVTDFIDEERPAYLTWEMAREMLEAGILIESHGRNHVSLANKDDDYLVWQALGSLETIEYELGVRPRFVSYPAGEYDQRTIDIFQSAHYWGGLTTRQGAILDNQRLFELPRIRVRNTTTPDELIRLLSLDW
jgi:peptidoglycan/xylan/chitin deacetylase (PgdA/CDA1 family)